MNVAGISTALAPHPHPVVTPVAAAEHTSTATKEHEGRDQEQHREQLRRTAIEAPKMRPLSTTEVRVMLGMAPVEALRAERDEQARIQRRGGFDDYA